MLLLITYLLCDVPINKYAIHYNRHHHDVGDCQRRQLGHSEIVMSVNSRYDYEYLKNATESGQPHVIGTTKTITIIIIEYRKSVGGAGKS